MKTALLLLLCTLAAQAADRLDAVLKDWPHGAVALVENLRDRYGKPDALTPGLVEWRDRGGVARISVRRHPAETPLEHVVYYDVPPVKLAALAIFSNGVEVRNSELSAHSNSEALNFLALNLADEIIREERTPDEARAFFDQTVARSFAGKESKYMKRLLFKPR
jgi:hypothetical protein